MKEKNEFLRLLSTSIISSIIFCINLVSIYYIFVYLDLLIQLAPYLIVCIGIFFFFLNFNLFVKKKAFLKQNFKKDKKGGYAIIFLLALTTIIFITVANFNRAKIFAKRDAVETK